MKDDSHSGGTNKNAASNPVRPDFATGAQKELDSYVRKSRNNSLEYFKLLKDELAKTDHSRTRHTYVTWLLVGMFLLLDSNAATFHLEALERIDQTILLRLLPAAIIGSYYVMMSRMFVYRERFALYDALAERLFPGKHFPFSAYIRPTHFMLPERLLNLARPPTELLGNNAMLALILNVTIYGPAVASIYSYYVILTRYGLSDGLVKISAVVGLVCLWQVFVVLRGVYVLSKQDLQNNWRLNSAGSVKNRSRKQ